MAAEGFVVLSMPRTGSNMMAGKLATNPRIMCLPAIFTPRGWPKAKIRRDMEKRHGKAARFPDNWDTAERRTDDIPAVIEFLRDIYDDRQRFGFKHHLGHPDDRTTRKVIDLEWPAVLLSRANALASYSSKKIVQLTGQGALPKGVKPIRAKAAFDAEEFENSVPCAIGFAPIGTSN